MDTCPHELHSPYTTNSPPISSIELPNLTPQEWFEDRLNIGQLWLEQTGHRIVRFFQCPTILRVFSNMLRILSTVAIALMSLNTLSASEDASTVLVGDTSYTVNQLEREFDQVTIHTVSTWTQDRIIEYTGPALLDVADKSGLAGQSGLKLTSADEYSVTVPRNEAELYQPIIAIRVDGQRIGFKDKGPARMVWPRSQYPDEIGAAQDGYWLWYLISVSEN